MRSKMDNESKARPDDVSASVVKRRSYSQPRLERFGTLTEITNNTMGNGMMDGQPSLKTA